MPGLGPLVRNDGWFLPGWPNLVSAFHPLMLDTALALPSVNTSLGIRVIVPRSGVLRDLAAFVQVSSGNIDAGVYSTAGTRARLWSTGSIACPTGGQWNILGDPALPVASGQQLDFHLGADNTTATFGGHSLSFSSVKQLPTVFWAAAGGALPKLASTGPSFPLPATITEANVGTTSGRLFGLIARISDT
jgi:hypothetical protein